MRANTIDTVVQRKINNKTYQLGFKVELIPEHDFIVQDFIKRTIHVCDLEVSVDDTQLFLNGFIIPKKSSIFSIKSNGGYVLKILESNEEKPTKKKSKSIKKFLKWAYLKQNKGNQIENCQSQQQAISQDEQSNNSQTPVEKKEKIAVSTKKSQADASKKAQSKKIKSVKPIQQKKRTKNAIKSVSSKSDSAESQHQSGSAQQESSLSQDSQSSDLQDLRGLITQKKKQVKQNPILAKEKINDRSKQFSSSNKVETSRTKQILKQPSQVYKDVIKTLRPVITSNIQQKNIISHPPILQKPLLANNKQQKKTINQSQQPQTVKNSNFTNQKSGIKLRQIINGSSQSQQSLQQKKPQKVKMLTATVRPTLIPFSVKRNNEQKLNFCDKKSNVSSFKEHKDNQWIGLSENLIKYYGEKNLGQYLIQPKNEIRFKTIQLDEQKFTPVLSDWIQGVVVSANPEQIKLERATKGTQYLGQYTVAFHNMAEPNINRLYLQQKQKAIVGVQTNHSRQKQDDQKQLSNTQLESDKTEQPFKKQGDVKLGQSVQDFVCGQINYYFSDKNYSGDLFMQMHANRHPQKYIDVAFMLNFPKIKKTMIDKKKLIEFLQQDPRKNTRNFQLDQERGLIRKKGIQIEHQRAQQKGQHKQDDQVKCA